MRLRRLALAPFVLLGPLPVLAQSAAVARRIAAVEAGLVPNVPIGGMRPWTLRERMRVHGVPGVSVAVVHRGRVEWAKAWGFADTATRRPMTPATPLSAGSVSKLVTAMVALRLAQEGRVALDAPVQSLLGDWRLGGDSAGAARATLRLLLQHRGGTSQASYFGIVPRDGTTWPTTRAIVDGAPGTGSRRVVVNQPVDAGFAYSGGGYMVAQLALETATGTPLATLARTRLFDPLAMRQATFTQPLPPDTAARVARAYGTAPWFEGTDYVYPQLAAAGLYATPRDLAALVVELQRARAGRGRVLDSATVRAMLVPRAVVSDGDYREEIGTGVFLLRRRGRDGEASRWFEHTGVNAGFVTYLVGDVAGGDGAVTMMNADGGAAELGRELRRAIARTYRWRDFVLDSLVAVAAPPATLDAIAGRYRRGPDEVVTLTRTGDRLDEVVTSGPWRGAAIPAVLVGRDSIGFSDFPGVAVVVRDGAGAIGALRFPWRDAPSPRMRDDEHTAGELLAAGRFDEARAAYRALAPGESPLGYLIYELVNRRPVDRARLAQAATLLALGDSLHPGSALLRARRAEYERRLRELGGAAR